MALSFYQSSIPVFVKALTNLRGVLQKGQAHAAARKIDESVLVTARLYPDMRPLSFQVQVATDMARGGAARLAGEEPPKFDDNETTFDQLIARVDRTLEYLAGRKQSAYEGADARTISRPVRGEPHQFTAQNFLQQVIVPNLYFHCATAYGILRHNGVELGKSDFLGTMD